MSTPPVRPAASVLLVRDGDDGVEVLIQRRSLGFAFVGGGWVFPGGALDADDRAPSTAACMRGWGDVEAAARLDLPHGALCYWAAAVRDHPEQLQSDRIHPSLRGSHLFAKTVRQALATLSERHTGKKVVLKDLPMP